MANVGKVSADKLKTHVHESFEHIRKALNVREQLLTRQIDVLVTQQKEQQQQQQSNQPAQTTTIPIDQMKFIAENEANILSHIRAFGKFNVSNYNFNSDAFAIEDYVCPVDDHDLMYKCLKDNETQINYKTDDNIMYKDKAKRQLQQNADGKEDIDDADDGIVVDFSNNKAIIEENANILNDSIVNITLNESRQLIERSQPKKTEELKSVTTIPNQQSSLVLAADETLNQLIDSRVSTNNNNNNSKSIYSKKPKQKLRLHTCTGNINLKNISNVTINTNCRALTKKPPIHHRKDKNLSNNDDSGSSDDTDGYGSYNCEFYKRLMNEIRNTFSKTEDIPSGGMNQQLKHNLYGNGGAGGSSTLDTSKSSSMFQSDSQPVQQQQQLQSSQSSREQTFLRNFQNFKLNIPPVTAATASGNFPDMIKDAATHPVQIEEWLKQIFLDTEIEPMQNVEILEHSRITNAGSP